MNVLKKEKGFTIIEVVLVLAIAGLIFLMVFVALPALQRGQRDQARKNEASTVISAVTTFSGNSRGQLPTSGSDISKIVNGNTSGVLDSGATVTVKAPSSYPVTITAPTASNLTDSDSSNAIVGVDEIYVYRGGKCGATTNGALSITAGTSRQVAVVVVQEAGNGMLYCQGS